MNLMKDRIWPACAAAFALHSLAISALAMSMISSLPGKPQILKDNFCVEMVFHETTQSESLDDSGEALEPETVQEDRKRPEMEVISFKKPLKKNVQKKAESGNQIREQSTSTSPSSEANNSQPLFNPPPVYPREARRRKVQGVVMIRASLSPAGAVAGAETVPPRVDPLLEDAALKAIHQWRFKPGIRTVEVPIEFKLLA